MSMSQSKAAVPTHVAIIMDGNGRWAQQKGKERVFGHLHGVESVRACVRAARRFGVRYLTLYAFSTENWGRPQQEVDALMELLCKAVIEETDELCKEGVRVVMIGDRDGFSPKVKEHISLMESKTAQGGELTLALALNYSSYSEITRAVRQIADRAAKGEIQPEQITPETISEGLYTASMPNPDLLIRTGGELRVSNFLLWQICYTELYFTPVFWPDFGEEEFARAIDDYTKRQRRFGLVNVNE